MITTKTASAGSPRRLVLPTRARALFLVLVALLATIPALSLVVTAGGEAEAHGTPMKPGSRTFLCWQDGLTDTGEIKPVNPACKNAQQVSGTTPFYNWFSVLRSDGAGRTRGFVPDGELCSGGNTNFTGFNAARDDWPLTHLTSGATVDFSYNAWAAHPGWFYVYITKDGFDPKQTLTWDDMEDQPFLSVDHPPLNGSPGNVEANYSWNGKLPDGKSGRHLIYMVWQRSDSAETFYSCSDVVFDGGNGEVTGIHDPGNPTDPVPGTCTATRKTTGSWNGGYQSEVTVTNSGDVPMLGWMVDWTLPGGQKVDSLWSGNATYAGQAVMVHNADWNGSLDPGESTTFGYVVSGSGGDTATTLPCRVG
ncbi:lytic polysaccharide monooxygenase [Streptomyces sp. V4I2]|uniref:lytic polysaccharide monooxygenase auxiliary activity family 9 protein n=1 Tax=Streptomyces sp. V4I2 TaxID=3042280 RepID=UPI0027833419|nr:lytic polysaccharide monooxygenase [Streptomyces sp. V4I2]MDQ1049296.1 putative carbohydrate-binding protein with CBM5 and CBM33 domain [Streptomyces sp. V4I2]